MPLSEQFVVAQRPSGSVFMRCIGIRSIGPDIVSAIQEELEQFVDECHSVFICYVSAIKSMETRTFCLCGTKACETKRSGWTPRAPKGSSGKKTPQDVRLPACGLVDRRARARAVPLPSAAKLALAKHA